MKNVEFPVKAYGDQTLNLPVGPPGPPGASDFIGNRSKCEPQLERRSFQLRNQSKRAFQQNPPCVELSTPHALHLVWVQQPHTSHPQPKLSSSAGREGLWERIHSWRQKMHLRCRRESVKRSQLDVLWVHANGRHLADVWCLCICVWRVAVKTHTPLWSFTSWFHLWT